MFHSAYQKILRLIGSVPEHRRDELERKDEYFISNGSRLFKKLVKSSHGKNNSIRIFSLKEIQKATNNFSEDQILNYGHSYSPAYRGIIEDRHVAVKISFFTGEVISLSLIKHRNVVKLLGCCLETGNPIVVHELPPNGTLEENIFPKKLIPPPVELLWTDRLRIATEIADALSYLHSELNMTHGGLYSTQAVLLDEFHSAKLGAFDFSKIQNQAESSDDRTDNENKFRKLKDVYNFGNILLDLLCIQTYDISEFTKVEILKYVKLNESEKEMPQIEAYIDLFLRCKLPWEEDGEDELPSMEEVAQELRCIYKKVRFSK